jgi:hypothetical protein
MTLFIFITKNLTVQFHPLSWFLLPQHHISGSWNGYQWLCVTINHNHPTVSQKNWSDDDIVRQMKNLEKEVESIKPKSKTTPSVKRKNP